MFVINCIKNNVDNNFFYKFNFLYIWQHFLNLVVSVVFKLVSSPSHKCTGVTSTKIFLNLLGSELNPTLIQYHLSIVL